MRGEQGMAVKKTIQYIHEPTDLQCGQAVLAMVTGCTVEQVVRELENERETTLKEMKSFLRSHGVWVSDKRIPVLGKDELPAVFHRKNHCEWLVTMRLPDWVQIYGEFYFAPVNELEAELRE